MTCVHEVFGHDGMRNYITMYLELKGLTVSMASQLSALTFVNTLALRSTNAEVPDVATN